ncbi:MAG: hypothetical protein QOF78_596 [Phycisphaerales bacterium]|jgi:uncharacterized membrane protein YdbT with pleckstrin-like domain|nr:hypothetical protein [Phycisphaerales bacterium]
MQLETCANCGERIGELETPHVWNERIVCERCHVKLSPPAVAAADANIPLAYASPTTPIGAAKAAELPERILFETTLHPLYVYFLPALLICTVLLAPIGVVFLIPANLRLRFSSFTITSRRVVAKSGWFHQTTKEMLLQKIESVQVEQNWIEKQLDSGSVVIVGTGGSPEPFRGICAPIEFRDAALRAVSEFA